MKIDKLLEHAAELADSKAIKNARYVLNRINRYYAEKRKSESWTPKEIVKYHSIELQRFIDACKAPAMEYLQVHIEWKKSRTWGWCPRSYIRIDGKEYTSYASGYGYDKLSSCVSSAMSESPSWYRFIIENCRKQKATKCYPFSWNYAQPSFSFAGCGMSCLSSFLTACGWKKATYHEESYDRDGSLIGLYYSAK